MDEIGPATMQRMKAIQKKVEAIGRDIGIPEDRAVVFVEIDAIAQNTQALRDSARPGKFDWKKFIEKVVGYIHGELKKEG